MIPSINYLHISLRMIIPEIAKAKVLGFDNILQECQTLSNFPRFFPLRIYTQFTENIVGLLLAKAAFLRLEPIRLVQ
jgi:hypothetical protein